MGLTREQERAAWYLAGVFDGEGWISLPKGGSGTRLSMANTEWSIIETIKMALDTLGIEYTEQMRPLSEGNGNHQDLFVVVVGKRMMCERFIKLVPFQSEAKRTKAEQLCAGRRKLKAHERPVGRLIELRDVGFSQRAAAQEMGIGYTTIKRWVQVAHLSWPGQRG
jgi:predicted DNA-binding protein (UPF0251 family)